MKFEHLINSWDKQSQNESMCACWIIDAPQETILYPGVVNEIIIKFEGEAFANLLRINRHMVTEPWKVLSDSIYFNQQTHSLLIPIITTSLHTLPAGEPICHVEMLIPHHTPQNKKGKNYTIKNPNFYFIFYITVTFNLFLFSIGQEDIYYSDDDDNDVDNEIEEGELVEPENKGTLLHFLTPLI
jgi:hypothetical protein